MKKNLCILSIVGSLMIPNIAMADTTIQFEDVYKSDIYAQDIYEVSSKGYMIGNGENLFKPNERITKVSTIQALYNLAGKPETKNKLIENVWYADATNWALDIKLLDNMDDLHKDVDMVELADILGTYAKIYHLPAFENKKDLDENLKLEKIADDSLANLKWSINSEVFSKNFLETREANSKVLRFELASSINNLSKLEIIDAQTYIKANSDKFFLTGKTSYTIQGKMVSKETKINNYLEDADYTVKDDNISVILKGTADEQWVVKLEKVLKTYTKEDGTELKAEDFTNSKDEFISIKTKAEKDTNFALFVPANTALEVKTAWGDILYANRYGVPHGSGDYLVCRNDNGKPDLTDVWIVNGMIFPSTYDTSNKLK